MNPTEVVELVESHVHERHERMAIVGIDSVESGYTIFDLIVQLQDKFPSYEVRLLRPAQRDTTDVPGIVLVTDKTQLSEESVTHGTVYLADNTNNLKRELVRYAIDYE